MERLSQDELIAVFMSLQDRERYCVDMMHQHREGSPEAKSWQMFLTHVVGARMKLEAWPYEPKQATAPVVEPCDICRQYHLPDVDCIDHERAQVRRLRAR